VSGDPADGFAPVASYADLIARHRTLDTDGRDPDRPALVRRDEVLVARADVDRFRSAVSAGYIDDVQPVTDAVSRVRLRASAGVRLGELSADLGGRSRNPIAVTPNHVMYACLPPTEPVDPEESGSAPPDGEQDRRGEWWGGRPIGQPDVGTMSAQAGGPPGGMQPDGEWWGGPVDQPRPVPPFDPPASASTAGAAVRIGVLDTGVVRHPWWVDAPWFARVADDDREEIDRHPVDQRRDRQAGHGTFVAGMVVQGARDADLTIERVLRSDGLCDEAELLAVLHRIAAAASNGQRLDLLNLSFGGYTYDDQPSPHVAAAIAAVAEHAVIVAAAGNHGDDRPFWPAALPDVIAVGALTSDGTERAAFSNFGPWVDTYRRGVGLTSAFVTFPTHPSEPPDQPTFTGDPIFDGYARWSGTSFAAPVVTAEIARAIAGGAEPGATATAIRAASARSTNRPADGRVDRQVDRPVDRSDDRVAEGRPLA
jgi:hypothetical protein